MATSFITYTPHGVAESSALLATEAGHIENVRISEALDNGSFIAIDGFEEGSVDVWVGVEPKEGDDVYLVLSVPQIYEDYTKKMQEESNFFNAAGDVVRAYQLFKRDKFALSAEAFADDAEPEVGKYLKIDGYKASVQSAAPTKGVVAKIFDVATNGLFRIVVEDIIA